MGILAKLGFIFIILVIGIILLYFYDKPLFYSIITSATNGSKNINIVMQQQRNFTNAEIKAIESSSPIPIEQVLVFGSWKNITQRICGQEQANFGLTGTSLLNVLYNDYYVPIYVNVQALGNYAPNLVGQKVYLNFVINNDENISTYAPYIVKSEVIKNNIEYWNFTFDGNTNNAINSMLNLTTANITGSYLNGIILANHTALISPKNIDIDNGNFIAPNC